MELPGRLGRRVPGDQERGQGPRGRPGDLPERPGAGHGGAGGHEPRGAKGGLEIVTPAESILAEPTVAVVDKVAARRKTAAVATAYLEFLYTKEGQRLAAKRYYRPVDPDVAKESAATFPKLALFTIDEAFGGWAKAQQRHFADGGEFDKMFSGRKP
jgi:ABC-type sulfate transport system substrate-binding protein